MMPEISVEELGRKLKSRDPFILLDVREPNELDLAKITDERLELLPMSLLAHQGIKALPESVRGQEVHIYVMCHHGQRSAQVTRWLAAQGWSNIFNVAGGIDAYARRVDPSVGLY